jgi:hypothetical protein
MRIRAGEPGQTLDDALRGGGLPGLADRYEKLSREQLVAALERLAKIHVRSRKLAAENILIRLLAGEWDHE